MTTAYFSQSLNSFIPSAWKNDGTYNEHSWPADAIFLTQEDTDRYWKQSPPPGKQLGSLDGKPAWIDIPPPTKERLVVQVERQKLVLRSRADFEISWRQDAVTREKATDEEVDELIAWLDYRLAVMRVKPNSPEWPTPPDLQTKN